MANSQQDGATDSGPSTSSKVDRDQAADTTPLTLSQSDLIHMATQLCFEFAAQGNLHNVAGFLGDFSISHPNLAKLQSLQLTTEVLQITLELIQLHLICLHIASKQDIPQELFFDAELYPELHRLQASGKAIPEPKTIIDTIQAGMNLQPKILDTFTNASDTGKVAALTEIYQKAKQAREAFRKPEGAGACELDYSAKRNIKQLEGALAKLKINTTHLEALDIEKLIHQLKGLETVTDQKLNNAVDKRTKLAASACKNAQLSAQDESDVADNVVNQSRHLSVLPDAIRNQAYRDAKLPLTVTHRATKQNLLQVALANKQSALGIYIILCATQLEEEDPSNQVLHKLLTHKDAKDQTACDEWTDLLAMFPVDGVAEPAIDEATLQLNMTIRELLKPHRENVREQHDIEPKLKQHLDNVSTTLQAALRGQSTTFQAAPIIETEHQGQEAASFAH